MLPKVTSPANPLVKMLKSLHLKKGRAETGLFLAEGARLAAEAADLGIWPEIMTVSTAALTRPQTRRLAERAAAAGAKVIETSPALLEQISKRDNPQTVIGAYRRLPTRLSGLPAQAIGLYVALERVRDPGNLGAILRTADAAGVSGVILVGETCDPFSVEAVRASMGAIFAAPFATAELEEFSAWRLGLGLKLYGASLKGAMRHDAPEAGGGICLFMGNEQAGLTDTAEGACDALVKIPMRGKADSLNLSAATAVMIYDFWRRRAYEGAR